MLQIQRRGVAQVRQLPVVLQQYNTAFLEAMWIMMMIMKLVINGASGEDDGDELIVTHRQNIL